MIKLRPLDPAPSSRVLLRYEWVWWVAYAARGRESWNRSRTCGPGRWFPVLTQQFVRLIIVSARLAGYRCFRHDIPIFVGVEYSRNKWPWMKTRDEFKGTCLLLILIRGHRLITNIALLSFTLRDYFGKSVSSDVFNMRYRFVVKGKHVSITQYSFDEENIAHNIWRLLKGSKHNY